MTGCPNDHELSNNQFSDIKICVVPMQRRWRDKNYPELVLATSIDAK